MFAFFAVDFIVDIEFAKRLAWGILQIVVPCPGGVAYTYSGCMWRIVRPG